MDNHRQDRHCASFCQIRTYFEWSEERPFPHSECHYPIKCGMTESESTSWSYRWGGTGKVQYEKALKIGITGSYSWGESKAMGHSWSINLKRDQCGYFTFIPVRKITCGTMSEGKWTYQSRRSLCSEEGAEHIGNYCADQMWNINDNGKLVPDGVIIFVWTNCLTREPLPMDKQDPAYRAPGVALDVKTLQSLQQGWVWNTCYLWDMGKDGKKRLFMRGSGFRDDMIGANGEKLFKAVKECTKNKMEGASFDWYYNGYPNDSPKVQGATWLFKADVPEKSDPDCFGRHLMLMGAVTQDKCQ